MESFLTSGIPTVTPNPPADEKRRFSSPISSTLTLAKRDAVLVDTFMTVDQNDVLVDWVRGSGKNLTTIYITHGHRDHLALVVRTGILPMASRLMCRLCGLDRNSRIGMLWACRPF